MTRLKDAQELYDRQRWVGATYLAGRAVEAMLRALLWRAQRQQEVGHGLPLLLSKIGSLGLLKGREDDVLTGKVNEVAVVWNNDLRFVGDERFGKHLRRVRRDRRLGRTPVLGDPAKANAKSTVENCEQIIIRGEMVWQRSGTS